jgi:hypothetical protein
MSLKLRALIKLRLLRQQWLRRLLKSHSKVTNYTQFPPSPIRIAPSLAIIIVIIVIIINILSILVL